METVKLETWHMVKLKEAGAARYATLSEPQMADLARQPHQYACLIDGEVVAAAGVVEYWTGRGEAWAMLAPGSRPHALPILKSFRKLVKECPIRRIEAAVGTHAYRSRRFAQLVGFQLEAAQLRGYLPNGGDVALYARVNHG